MKYCNWTHSISSWLKSGCLSITLHYITNIQLSSKLELNLNWILGCCLNMWLVFKKNKQDKTHKCENTWNKIIPRRPKGVGRNINLVNPTLSPYLTLKFIRFPVFLDLLLWRQTTLQSHLISSLCSLYLAVHITGNWYHSGLDNDLKQELSGFLKSYLGAVWMPLWLSTLRSWKSSLKSKLLQGGRDYVLLSPCVLARCRLGSNTAHVSRTFCCDVSSKGCCGWTISFTFHRRLLGGNACGHG